MPRSYHVEVVQHAVGADRKWIDNLLSHFDVAGVEAARQGVERRISRQGIFHIALIHRLNRELGVSVSAAVTLASRLLADHAGREDVGPWLELRIDLPAMEHSVGRLIEEASEMSAPARRGRPRQAPPSK
jgi:hypothetical protein